MARGAWPQSGARRAESRSSVRRKHLSLVSVIGERSIRGCCKQRRSEVCGVCEPQEVCVSQEWDSRKLSYAASLWAVYFNITVCNIVYFCFMFCNKEKIKISFLELDRRPCLLPCLWCELTTDTLQGTVLMKLPDSKNDSQSLLINNSVQWKTLFWTQSR